MQGNTAQTAKGRGGKQEDTPWAPLAFIGSSILVAGACLITLPVTWDVPGANGHRHDYTTPTGH